MSRSASKRTSGGRPAHVRRHSNQPAAPPSTPPRPERVAEETRKTAFRRTVLQSHGATASQANELLAYNEVAFDTPSGPLPGEDEPFVGEWSMYLEEAARRTDASAPMLSVLQERLVQLQFPIRSGMSDHPAYRAATRSIEQTDPRTSLNSPHATGLDLEAPGRLACSLHPTIAGHIPVLAAGTRGDFVRLVQAFLRRHEPVPLPVSMGAVMISGYVNWHRVHALRRSWDTRENHERVHSRWTRAFQTIPSDTTTYRDRLILVSPSPYSAVPADEIGMADDEWRSLSVEIRTAHEAAHYATRRICGVMRTALHDEIIADYAGIAAAVGRFRADWFCHFMGVEDTDAYRAGGRLENYRGELSDGAFWVLQRLAVTAAENLERLDTSMRHANISRTPEQNQMRMMIGLTQLSVEELASNEADQRLRSILRHTVDPLFS